MNSRLTVKLNSDTNYIKVKYQVVEMTVGTAGDGSDTYCVLTVIRNGWDTQENYENWKKWSRPTDGIQGTLGEFSVQPLSALSVYDLRTPSADM